MRKVLRKNKSWEGNRKCVWVGEILHRVAHEDLTETMTFS